MVGSRGTPVRKRSTRVVADSRANAAARWSRSLGRNRLRGAPPPRCALLVAVGGARTLLSGQTLVLQRPAAARRTSWWRLFGSRRPPTGLRQRCRPGTHTPCDLAANCCSPGSTNSDSDTPHHGGHPLLGSRTAAVASRAGTRPSTLEVYLPAGDRTPPDCQVDHGTFQSPYPSQDGIGVPPVLV